jgi:hypothetical protein
MWQKLVAGVLFFFVSALGSVSARQLIFGVKGGVPLTNAFQFGGGNPDWGNYYSDTKRYTVGPTVEMSLSRRFSIELNALYKRLDYGVSSSFMGEGSETSFTRNLQNAFNQWEFPLLVKFHPEGKAHGPYLAAGANLNYIAGCTTKIDYYGQNGTVGQFSSSGITHNMPEESARRGTGGIIAEGGWDFHLGILRLSPELRYTRWMNRTFTEPRWLEGPPFIRSNQNQIEFLLGVTLHLKIHGVR